MKKLTPLFLFMLFLVIVCGDDDDPTSPTGSSKDGVVLISGSGSSTEFDTFEFDVIPFFDWLIITSVKGTDTLLITLFDYQSNEVNSAISLTDSTLFVVAIFGSRMFAATNFNLFNNVLGSITFTSLDTSSSIAATFSSDATLETFGNTTEQNTTATITGDFVATKATGPAVAANIDRRRRFSRLLKRF